MNSTAEQLRIPILVVLISFLLLKFFPIPLNITSTVNNNAEMFTSTGRGEATGTPKTASFSVGVTKTGDSVEATQEETNAAANKVIEALSAQGIDKKDIKTDQYSVNPNIDYSDGTQVTSGYTVSTTLTVNVKDATKANAALDAATKAGANTLGGVSFVLTDDDREKLEDEARVEAIQDAKQKAVKISSQAGIKLGKVIGIYEAGPQMPIAYERSITNMSADAKEDTPTQLQPGENKVSVEVTLTYETL